MTDAGRQALAATLIRQEGLRLFPYTDAVGKLTVGVGRNLTDRGLTRAEALVLLDTDIDECLDDLASFPWFAQLNEPRQIAVLSLRFNVGAAGFRAWHVTLGHLAAGDPVAAAAQFRTNRRFFSQVKTRADWIADVIETGAFPTDPRRA